MVEFKQEATHTPAAVALPDLLNMLVDRAAPYMDALPYIPHLVQACSQYGRPPLSNHSEFMLYYVHVQMNQVLQRLVQTIDAHALSAADTARLCTASRYHEYG